MKRKNAFVVVLLLCSLFISGMVAAQTPEEKRRQDFREQRERRARETQRLTNSWFQGPPPPGTAAIVGRSVIYSVDSGFGNTIAMLEAGRNPKLREALGLNEQQAQQLKAANDQLRAQALLAAPRYAKRFKEMTESDKKTIQQDLIKDFQKISSHVEGFVTPEQKDKSRTLVFQAMGGLESPIINMDAMSTLKLDEQQRDKAKKTLKEMESERLAQMEEGLKLFEKAVALGGTEMSPEDREALRAEAKALEARIFATGKKLGERLRGHLTEEQRDLEKKLLAERPDFLPPLPGPMRGDYSPEYAPGLGSWMPGQGAPKEDLEAKRRRRPFPTKEKQTTEETE